SPKRRMQIISFIRPSSSSKNTCSATAVDRPLRPVPAHLPATPPTPPNKESVMSTTDMSATDRREFLKRTGQGAAAAATALALAGTARAAAGDKLIVGVIGPGGMGSNHLNLLGKNEQVRVAYVCDVDEKRLASAAETVSKLSGTAPQAVADMRRV